MKKILALVTVVTMIVFSRCSVTEPKTTGGVAVDKMISAYRTGAYVDVNTAKAKLTAAGFEIVGTYQPADNGTTILYTNTAMKADANKPTRG